VKDCAFSPDGKMIASASWDKTIKIWNTETGQLLQTIVGHTNFVQACVFSPDGQFILSASDDRSLKAWDPLNGRLIVSLYSPGAPCCRLGHTLGHHPWAPQIVCGVLGRTLYWFRMVGFEYGPIIVTAVEGEKGIEIQCPACRMHLQIKKDHLGSEITCPHVGCTLKLSVNPFVVQQPVQRKHNWLSKLLN